MTAEAGGYKGPQMEQSSQMRQTLTESRELSSKKVECVAKHGDVPGCAETLQKTWTCLSALPCSQHRPSKATTPPTTSRMAG